jgi:hypothetical protein
MIPSAFLWVLSVSAFIHRKDSERATQDAKNAEVRGESQTGNGLDKT